MQKREKLYSIFLSLEDRLVKALSTLSNNFNSYIKSLERTRRKIESLFSQGDLSRREIEQIYGSLFLHVVIDFESFIENMFLGLLTNRFKIKKSKIVPRVRFQSDIIARDVVLGGKRYVNWLPYEETENRAKIFFRNGLPFKSLDNNEIENLKNIHCIRNALAHRSRYSMQKFEKQVVGSMPLTKREKSPGGFLKSHFRISPTQTRYENLVSEMSTIVAKLCR